MIKSVLALAMISSNIFVANSAFAMFSNENDVNKYVEARLAEFASREDAALKSYLSLLKTNAGSAALTNRIYENAIKQGDMASAVRSARLMKLNNQVDGSEQLLLFADAFKRNDWREADTILKAISERNPLGFAAPLLRAWLNTAQGNPHGLTETEVLKQPQLGYYSTDQWVYLALAKNDIGSAKRMLSAFEKIDEEYARNLKIRSASIFAARGDEAFAKQLAVSQVEPQYLQSFTNVSSTESRAKITPQEGVSTIFGRLANALIDQKINDQGIVLARIANWLAPQNDANTVVLARALSAVNANDKAKIVYQSIPLKSVYWPKAVSENIRLNSSDSSQGRALAIAQDALKQSPDSNSLMLTIAQIYENSKNYPAAIGSYQKMLSILDAGKKPASQRAMVYLFLGTAQDKSNDWPSARKSLDEARQLDPNNPYILNYLGYSMLERRENMPVALDYVRRAYSYAPDSAAIADSLGWGYHLNNQNEKAIPLLELAVKQSGNDMAVNEHLGDAYWAAGRRQDARYAWKIAAQNAVDADAVRLSSKIDIGIIATSPKK
jgi:tetratricopeptide (TPR) repeat protein